MEKIYFKVVLSCSLIIICLVSLFVCFVDPYMYYGKKEGVNYYFYHSFFNNPGIAKHMDYETVVLGSSMLENTDTKLLDKLFNTKSIKLTQSGSYANDLKQNFDLAKSNKNLKNVFINLESRSYFDREYFHHNKTIMGREFTFLMDNNIFNDVSYLLNKNIILNDLKKHIEKNLDNVEIHELNEAQKWDNGNYKFAKEEVLKDWENWEKEKINPINESYLKKNVEKNILKMIEENPNIKFNFIIPPVSILMHKKEEVVNGIDHVMHIYKYIIGKIIDYENVQIYNFLDDYEIIENLDLYKDLGHYNSSINDYMLKEISKGNKLLSKDNYNSMLDNLYIRVKNYSVPK